VRQDGESGKGRLAGKMQEYIPFDYNIIGASVGLRLCCRAKDGYGNHYQESMTFGWAFAIVREVTTLSSPRHAEAS